MQGLSNMLCNPMCLNGSTDSQATWLTGYVIHPCSFAPVVQYVQYIVMLNCKWDARELIHQAKLM